MAFGKGKAKGASSNEGSGGYYRTCDHWRSPFELDGGLVIHVSAYSDEPNGKWNPKTKKYDPAPVSAVAPTLGFYLADAWKSGTMVSTSLGEAVPFGLGAGYPRILYPWSDGSVPTDVADFEQALGWVLGKLASGAVVDCGCYGAHGRTGTFLASLLVMQGEMPGAAIARVRDTHCRNALETVVQVEYVQKLAERRGIESSAADQATFTHELDITKPKSYGLEPIGFVGSAASMVQKSTGDVAWSSTWNEECSQCGHGAGFHDSFTFDGVTTEWCEIAICDCQREVNGK